MQSTCRIPVKLKVLRTRIKLRLKKLRKSRIRADLRAVNRTNRLVIVLEVAAQETCLQWVKVRIRDLLIWRLDQKYTCPNFS